MPTTVFMDARTVWQDKLMLHGRPRVDRDSTGERTNPDQPEGDAPTAAGSIFGFLMANTTPPVMLELKAMFANFTTTTEPDRGGGT